MVASFQRRLLIRRRLAWVPQIRTGSKPYSLAKDFIPPQLSQGIAALPTI
jgi:hypothetical protein